MDPSKYYDGKPCLKGHGTLRFKSNKACVVCNQERKNAWRRKNYDPAREKVSNARNYRKRTAKVRSTIDTWRKEHPDRYAEIRREGKRRHRDQLRGATGSYTQQEMDDLRTTQKVCAYCPSTEDLTLDHKTPLVRGGTNFISNLHLACRPCNSAKGAMTHEEFSAKRGIV